MMPIASRARRSAALIALAVLGGGFVPGASADDGFDPSGALVVDPGPRDDFLRGIAFAGDAFVVVGLVSIGDDGDREWRIEKRTRADGALDPAFGEGGIVTSNPTPRAEGPSAVAIVGASVYVAGREAGATEEEPDLWRIEKRSLADGHLDDAFGSGGVVSEPVDGRPYALLVDARAMYVVGTDLAGWRIEKRSLSDGALIPHFGRRGVVSRARHGEAYAAVLDRGALFVGGSSNDALGWRIERRSAKDGRLQWSRSRRFEDEGCGEQGIYGLAVADGSLFAVGSASGFAHLERYARLGRRQYAVDGSDEDGECSAATAVVVHGDRAYVATGAGLEERLAADGTLVRYLDGVPGDLMEHDGLLYGLTTECAPPDFQARWRIDRRPLD